MTLSIAVAGKGGIGKTTLAALLVRAVRGRGIRPILAVDADPAANLAEALGIEQGKTLAEIREEGSAPEGSPSSGIGRVRAVEDELQRAVSEGDGFDLVTMGRPEGPRCYCAVNNLLRTSLGELASNYAAVVIDNEAGMEHLSRRTTNDIDFLVAVLNPTRPSVRAAQRIVALSRELPMQIGCRAVVLNRLGPEGVPAEVQAELQGLDAFRLPNVPEDLDLMQAGAVGRDVFSLPAPSPAQSAVEQMAEIVCKHRECAS